MDLQPSHQEPRGPMTRARARALENEVTSFLSNITYDPLETWLLPKSDMLCMIRCQEEPPEDAREADKPPSPRMKRSNGRRKLKLQGPDTRPTARTSGPPRPPGHPAPSPDIRPPLSREPEPCHTSPDIRPPARTSGRP